jgi:uncharacterized protein YprB with RNaseH-like and TPR domain
MDDYETRACAYCGTSFETKDPRKVYCSKQHADRSRNLPRTPAGDGGLVELRDFSKFPVEIKQRILRGETGARIVSFDLECTSLKPTVGRILCASFVPLGGKPYTFSAIERPYRKPDVFDDSRLTRAIRDELEKFDIIISWNGKEFDLKFLNSRLMRGGERTKNPQYHVDGMWSWRSKASAWSKLDAVQKFILPTGTHKTEIEWEQWMRALGWDKTLRNEAMAVIIRHCEADVMVLQEVYGRLVDANAVRSIRLDGGIL